MKAAQTVTTKTIITPAMAEKWLEKAAKIKGNYTQRSPLESNIKSLFEKMKKNKWVITTDPIAFDVDGILENGRHRLLALIRYGKELPFIVSRVSK